MSHNVRFVEEVEKQPPPVWPRRVKILMDDYANASKELSKSAGRPISVHYQHETVDYLEKIFDMYAHENPNSLKFTVNAVYRVKTKIGEEYYYYAGFKTCNNKLNQPEPPFSWEQWGFHRSPKIGLQWNEQREINEPKVVGYQSCYELKWNKDEVKKLLDNSFIPCEYFYIGKAGEREPIEVPYYSIMNIQDFLEGSWDDLYDLGRLGCSYKEPSLNLVESARKKERQDREEKVGLRGKSARAYA